MALIIDKFVREVATLRNRKRADQYCLRLGIFLEIFEKTYIDKIGDDEVIRFLAELRRRQLCERTIKNYCTDLVAFLRRYELHHRVKKSFIPKPTLKVVRVYPVAVLQKLFAAANPEDRILYWFFFGLGMREREVMFAAWQDIDFQRGIFHVTEKKADGFTIKDRGERSIPIPVRERCVRTTVIIFASPGFDQMLCLLQVHEPVGVQALGTEGSVEAFHEGVVRRLAGP